MPTDQDRRARAILKLNKILKQGHIPCRFFKPYSLSTTHIANCFIHSVYNLSEKQLKSLNSLEMDEIKMHIHHKNAHNQKAINESIFSVIKESGLQVEQVDKCYPCAKNQWIVAYYLSVRKDSLKSGAKKEFEDYHFMLREKNGYWSEKLGPLQNVNKYTQPPLTIDRYSHIYQLQGFYLITNPYTDKQRNNKLLQEEEYER